MADPSADRPAATHATDATAEIDEVGDALDEVVAEVRREFPDLAVTGLPVTGRIMRLARHLEHRREERLAEFGLTVGDFDMLATMRRKHADDQPMNVRDLQRSLMLSSGGTTKRLDRLERAGLLARGADPGDRRGVLVALTPAGLELIDEALPAITDDESKLLTEALPDARERGRVEAGLRRVLSFAERRRPSAR